MNTEQITAQLTLEKLRIADSTETGWTYSYINDEGERITLWVTEVACRECGAEFTGDDDDINGYCLPCAYARAADIL